MTLGSADPTSSARFFCDELGGELVDDTAETSVSLPGGVRLQLRLDHGQSFRQAVVAVDDLEAVGNRLEALSLRTVRQGAHIVVTDRRLASGELVLGQIGEAVAPVGPATEGGTAGVQALDHVCLVVSDLTLATAAVRAIGGWPVLAGDTSFGARGVQLRFPSSKIELLAPTAEGAIDNWLRRRRQFSGLQHMTFLVGDVPTAARNLRARGVETLGMNTSSPGWHEVFVRPRHTNGFVVQLASTTRLHEKVLNDFVVEASLAGGYTMSENDMRSKQ